MSETYYQIRYNPENKFSFSAPYKILDHNHSTYGYDRYDVNEVIESIKLFKSFSKQKKLNIWYVKITEHAYYLNDYKNGLISL